MIVPMKIKARISESLEMAFHEGKGRCKILYFCGKPKEKLQSTFEKDGQVFQEPSLDFYVPITHMVLVKHVRDLEWL